MLGDNDYATVDEALASLQRSRENLAAAWANIRAAMARGVRLPDADRCRWNALVREQVRGELEVLAFIAREDPDARFNGKTWGEALDDIRRALVLGDFAGVECASEGDARGAGLGEPVTISLGLGIVIATIVAALTVAFVVYTRTQLAVHEEQTARAKEATAAVVACLQRGGSSETCGRIAEADPYRPPDTDKLPGWAKGLIAAGVVAGGLIVLVQVLPGLVARRTVAAVAGCRT